LYFEI